VTAGGEVLSLLLLADRRLEKMTITGIGNRVHTFSRTSKNTDETIWKYLPDRMLRK
jgi:hypothetical protein